MAFARVFCPTRPGRQQVTGGQLASPGQGAHPYAAGRVSPWGKRQGAHQDDQHRAMGVDHLEARPAMPLWRTIKASGHNNMCSAPPCQSSSPPVKMITPSAAPTASRPWQALRSSRVLRRCRKRDWKCGPGRESALHSANAFGVLPPRPQPPPFASLPRALRWAKSSGAFLSRNINARSPTCSHRVPGGVELLQFSFQAGHAGLDGCVLRVGLPLCFVSRLLCVQLLT